MIQKIYKELSPIEKARKYYALLFLLNDIHVPDKEISLVAFSALNGSLTSPPIRSKFITLFNSSEGSVYNMMSNLQKKDILVKDEDRKIRVHPDILLPFNENVLLNILLSNETNRHDKEGAQQTVELASQGY